MNKKQLSQILSTLSGFKHQNVQLEQYPTPSEIAASALWTAFMNGHIGGKVVADFGCGPGILGFGAALLGAKRVYMVDIDPEAIAATKHNLKTLEKQLKKKLPCKIINLNVKDFNKTADTVIQNPPFGVKKTHSDQLFLVKATETAQVVYTFHKLSTKEFISRFTRARGFRIKEILPFKFSIPRIFWFHIKSVHFVDAGCWILIKDNAEIGFGN